mmetsp:Transcript_87285/g.173245  ORF Transcript_87285/g.173245 Transcript_87285/m.173245 type:complete len:203 (-) Transcript_87285:157-765(-)
MPAFVFSLRSSFQLLILKGFPRPLGTRLGGAIGWSIAEPTLVRRSSSAFRSRSNANSDLVATTVLPCRRSLTFSLRSRSISLWRAVSLCRRGDRRSGNGVAKAAPRGVRDRSRIHDSAGVPGSSVRARGVTMPERPVFGVNGAAGSPFSAVVARRFSCGGDSGWLGMATAGPLQFLFLLLLPLLHAAMRGTPEFSPLNALSP